MNAEILCVGTELLLGDIVNTNAAFIAKELAQIGVNVYYQSVVGDNSERLKSSQKLALSRSDIVITTGGLGPTYDDLTKEAVAEFFNRKMKMHEPSLNKIKELFNKINREMTPNNEKQALMPEGATVFTNECGTAPGLAVEGDGKIVILLPGPPREVYPMFRNSVLPYLTKLTDHILVSKTIHIFGMGESKVEALLKDLMVSSTNPTVAPYAKDGEVQLRVTASCKDKNESDKLIDPIIEQIRGVIGDCIYGIDVETLQNAVVLKLKEKKKTLATAESCTGGLISKRITEIPGSSAVFGCGICAYSNEIKKSLLGVKAETLQKFGAVSQQTAIEMAHGVRKLSGADIGLSVTGIAGPTGDENKPIGLVYVCAASDTAQKVVELKLARGYENERELIRYLASSNALHLVLKLLQ
ncbi:MAG TPA: competence/damage-inducible protein A [Ruminococcaceae bacterium]|nr:competence/damage-inducible protein A [Oscillospiraceae bacterium]